MKMKKLPALMIVLGVVMAMGALGALVNYISNTITAEVEVESPIMLDENEFYFSPGQITGGDYEVLLIQGENQIDKIIPGMIEINLYRNDGGNWVPDSEGIELGFSEDIQYYFNSNSNKTWEEWMMDNPDWFDWYLTDDYPGVYDTSLVTNHGNNSVLNIEYVNNSLMFPGDIPPGDLYGIIVFQTHTNIQPAAYKVEVLVRPQ